MDIAIPKILRDLGTATLKVIARKLGNHVFAKIIEPFSIEQVHEAVIDNINLWERWGENDKNAYLKWGVDYKDTIRENINALTAKDILTFMAEKGDPWDAQVEVILNTPGGIKWFTNQVDNIKQEIIDYYNGIGNESA